MVAKTEHMTERAALVRGVTLTDDPVKLVLEDAPKILKIYSEIQLTNKQFDDFFAMW